MNTVINIVLFAFNLLVILPIWAFYSLTRDIISEIVRLKRRYL